MYVLDLDVYIISTELQFDASGICTGEIDQLVNGDIKVEKIKEWMNVSISHNGSVPATWAYADSVKVDILVDGYERIGQK